MSRKIMSLLQASGSDIELLLGPVRPRRTTLTGSRRRTAGLKHCRTFALQCSLSRVQQHPCCRGCMIC